MPETPPLPPGAKLVGSSANERPGADIFKPLYDLGVAPTNGFRTPADIQRLRSQGYKPATHSLHLKGDAVDLTPGTSGLSMREIQSRARALAKQNGYSVDGIFSEGDHVHAGMPGWGQAPGTPGTPHSGLPALPKGATLVQRGKIDAGVLRTTGEVHDGDTFRLGDGRNARLYGADAFELDQVGNRSGGSVPLGAMARSALAPFAKPGATVTPTGGNTYGRPVATLNNGQDAGREMIRQGMAVAAPKFLTGGSLLGVYMDAERQARLNRQGAWGGDFRMPDAHRKGMPDPWAAPEASPDGKGTAYFADERTPFQGLRPEIERGYLGIWQDMDSTPADLLAFADANGFKLDPGQVEAAYNDRAKTGRPRSEVTYQEPPRILTDPGDGVAGVAARGLADPFNFLDEMGGVANSLGVGGEDGPRENVWNSDRRFGDILWNNIDQNRSILANDDATHPYVRIGSQLAGALAIPALGEARTVAQLGRLGSIEGGLAGFGAGEGWGDRFRQGTLGTVVGGAGGATLGGALKGASGLTRRLRGDTVGDAIELGGYEAAPILNDGVQNAGPTPAAKYQPDATAPSRPARMDAEAEPALHGPNVRERDYLDLGAGGLNTFGDVRPMNEWLPPDEVARLFSDAAPSDVLPRPANTVDSFEEAMLANPGTVHDLQAPDEMAALDVRLLPSPKDLLKQRRVRGPLDMSQRLRSLGGIKDEGGELRHLDIGQPRKLEFGGQESFLGRLVNNDTGMSLDDATHRLWEEGYFPEFSERPTPNDLLDRLRDEAMGGTRYFHPEDLAEVDAFDAARLERQRIERAADEGAPLADRIGHAVDLDDLAINSPPLSAYEDAPRLIGKVGNINLDHIERPEDVGQILDFVSKRVGGFDAAARGKVTNEETARLAAELGMKPETLLQRQAGQALNAEQAYAARSLLRGSLEQVGKLAQKAVGGSDADKIALQKALLKHAAIQEQVSGATAEAGRTLQQFKMTAGVERAQAKAIREYLKGANEESLADAAEAVLDLMKDPAQANRFIQKVTKPRFRDKAVELYYNSLLSGPRTHAVNIISNFATALGSMPEHAGAYLFGGLRAIASKTARQDPTERILASELGARATGMVQGAVEGLRAARYTFKTGRVPDLVSKVEAAQQEAIGGKAGHIIRTPTRALAAEDEFFKAIARRSELAALATRKATQEGLKGDAFKSRIGELTDNPPDDMLEQALDFARYQTFQRPVGDIAGSVMKAANSHPLLKLVVPFVRTPTNILKFAAERSPAAPLLKEWRADMLAGGPRRDLALARATLGSGLGLYIAGLASEGKITGGGPLDENARGVMRADGWQPYSIKVGDQWVSYQRLDPLAMTLGIAADYVEKQTRMTDKQRDEQAMLMVASVIQNLSDKTWLSGLSETLSALQDPVRYGPSAMRRTAAGIAVPAVISQAASTIDKSPREAGTVAEAVQARIPVASQSLRPRLDAWGQPIVREGAAGPDIVSPFMASSMQDDPVNAEALRLNWKVTDPSRGTGAARMDDVTYHAFKVEAGARTLRDIRELMASPDYTAMTDAEKTKAFERIKRDARKAAKGEATVGAQVPSNPNLPPLPADLPPLPPGARLISREREKQ